LTQPEGGEYRHRASKFLANRVVGLAARDQAEVDMARRFWRSRGFTLVELLVVIGIIALLIAVLLPALNKARQQANLITCQTHLRQIGQAIYIYTREDKGILPPGYWNFNNNDSSKQGDWSTALTNELSSRLGDNYAQQATTKGAASFNRGVFLDVDVNSGGDAPLHYSCHPRLMPTLVPIAALQFDGTATHATVPYKIGSIKRSAEIVLIFDGGLFRVNAGVGYSDTNYWGALAVGVNPDEMRFAGGYGGLHPDYFLFNNSFNDDGATIFPGFNKDATDQFGTPAPGNSDGFQASAGDIRWRHLNNTAANFLFVDGHVESHSISPNPVAGGSPYKTDLMARNFNVNP
jgi:prepilin-type N-terminal cleavage/methylation domain-containing protein/prepilin-type processing-associated H-X9-DG protein